MKPTPIVLRRCVACRSLMDRRHLWRVIRLSGGGVVLEEGMGRSAYLCPTSACLEEARRHRRLQRALRCKIDDGILVALSHRLAGNACGQPLRQDEPWPQLACGPVAPLAPPERRPE